MQLKQANKPSQETEGEDNKDYKHSAKDDGLAMPLIINITGARKRK
jgi:hypothetical protein